MIKALLAVPLVVAGLLAASAPAAACSIRGNWCGYPLWAANAFEDRFGRVNPGTSPVLPNAQHGGYGVVAPGATSYRAKPFYRRDRPKRHRQW